ncbi:hypothetical protein RJ640_030481 [Escallonia rubra]|uniref:UBC core domain-containing protein n=1 Tax=Escallonia rubra TaxID=112253 RepID=A0AA88QR08_9ASTE|nr:hypothetical protein RJ640_030481 [Escallonia rubra]
MSGIDALERLGDERKAWRKSHPRGFAADQRTLSDNTVDLYRWKCIVPGKAGVTAPILSGLFAFKMIKGEQDDAFPRIGKKCYTYGSLLQHRFVSAILFVHEFLVLMDLAEEVSKTDWEGGYYPLALHFSTCYPSKPPKCEFPADFFHPNVYPTGSVYPSVFNKDGGWRPAISVKQILVGIQDLLDQPNPANRVHNEAYYLFIQMQNSLDI